MQLRLLKTIHNHTSNISSIRALAWSPNNRRLAIADSANIIYLYDENGEKKEKFTTKTRTGKRGMNDKSYMVTGLAFSPDSTKLAVAQSNAFVFIYKLGLEWGDKKTICNKFDQKTAAVTAITWPFLHEYEVVFGRSDGEVKIGNLRNHHGATLYRAESPCLSICSSPDGHGVLSGHADGTIHRWYFKEPNEGETGLIGHLVIAQHPSIPTSLAWGETLVVAGYDKKVCFYTPEGQVIQHFDYSKLPNQQDFTTMALSPSGQSVVVGSFNRFNVFNFNMNRNQWEEGELHNVPNLYSLSSMAWKPDGSRLVIGNVTGGVSLFDSCLKRYKYKNEFEFTYVSPSQVIVKRLSNGTRIVLKSLFGFEIIKVLTRGKYLIGYTPKTLLLGDLESCKLSEVPWNEGGNEKFHFENPRVCLVFREGDISIIEYGINDVIGSFRTQFVSPHLISVRILYRVPHYSQYNHMIDPMANPDVEGIKRIAYLTDSHTICVLDLFSSIPVAKISNDQKIDWLELNSRANKLLFRDKSKKLYLFDIAEQTKIPLLTYCSYVQWVPDSDVVVAQNRGDLCVWYSIDAPDRVTIVAIKGEVEDIVRSNDCTAVVVNEGPGAGAVNYALDEGLIQFGVAMEDHDYAGAADILDKLSLTPETEAMWRNLAQLVMADQKYHIAERCYAALGDVSKARYLRLISKEMTTIAEQTNMPEGNNGQPIIDPLDHWSIRAKVAIMSRDFKYAEQVYLEQGHVGEAMKMYEKMHKFEESIDIAYAKNVPNAAEKRAKYLKWLIGTRQHDKAARIYERDGDIVKAIDQYLSGGFPASAASLVKRQVARGGNVHDDLLDKIASALNSARLYQKSGEFYETRNMFEQAIEAYKKGNSYRHAVEVARKHFPEQVVELEEKHGDFLMAQKQIESAVNHYIEAGRYKKALEAALQARLWKRAEVIIENVDTDVASANYVKLARHYEEIQSFDEAKRFYIAAEQHDAALKMFERAGMIHEMLRVAEQFLEPEDITKMYLDQAKRHEASHKFREAEELYVKANEPDYAIQMYQKQHMFDDMIRLVQEYRLVHLSDAHIQIAEQLENEGSLRDAEKHYLRAGKWQNVVAMYREKGKWDDSIRVAKTYGPANYWTKVALEHAVALGGESGSEAGAQYLYKKGLVEEAINYCFEQGSLWNFAFDMARTSLESKLPDVHREYAVFLEENGRFKDAEEEYINAQCPREAVEMWIAQTEYNHAMRVAQTYDPTLINYVIEKRDGVDHSAQGVVDDDEGPSTIPILGQEPIEQDSDDDLQGEVTTTKKTISDAKKEAMLGNDNSNIVEKVKSLGKQHRWEDMLDLAKKNNILTDSVMMMYIRHLVSKEYKYEKALDVMKAHNHYPVSDANDLITFRKLARRVFWIHPDPPRPVIANLLDLLKEIEKKHANTSYWKNEMKGYLNIAHLMYMQFLLKDSNPELYAKVCVSLLRYCDIIPPDRCFYLAGEACAKVGENDMSFLFFSRFLDVVEALDELPTPTAKPNSDEPLIREMVELENGDYLTSDIPYNVPIPVKSYLDEEKKDEVTDEVLTSAISIPDPSLPKRTCSNCNTDDLYVAALSCYHCKHKEPACVITGYPIKSDEKVQCSNCFLPAVRDNWNAYIMKFKNCPSCGVANLTK